MVCRQVCAGLGSLDSEAGRCAAGLTGCALSQDPCNAANSSPSRLMILFPVLTSMWTSLMRARGCCRCRPARRHKWAVALPNWSWAGVGRMLSAHWRTDGFRGGSLAQPLQWLGARGHEPFEIRCVCVVPSAALQRSWGCQHPVPSAWSGVTAGGCKVWIFFLDLLCLCSRHCA